MRKRTEEEILSLTLRFETQRVEDIYGDQTISLHYTILEYGLDDDEQPKWTRDTNYDFTNASITEEEFYEELFEPVQKLIRLRNWKREQRLWKLNKRIYENNKYNNKKN